MYHSSRTGHCHWCCKTFQLWHPLTNGVHTDTHTPTPITETFKTRLVQSCTIQYKTIQTGQATAWHHNYNSLNPVYFARAGWMAQGRGQDRNLQWAWITRYTYSTLQTTPQRHPCNLSITTKKSVTSTIATPDTPQTVFCTYYFLF